MNRIKKGDTVRVIAGKEKGREGKILGFSNNGERVLVEGLNIVKRHTKPTTARSRPPYGSAAHWSPATASFPPSARSAPGS